MTVGHVNIDRAGSVVASDVTTRPLLAEHAGKYRVHRAGTMLVMTLDEGTGAVAREGETLCMCGDVSAMPMLALMNLLGQNRETGRLVLKRGSIERVVLLHNGDVASIGSNLAADRLGTFLVRLGKVSERALEEAQDEATRTGKRIGQALLARGLIDTHQLWRAIQEQITELFADAVQWEDGSFILYRLAPNFQFPSTPPLPMQGLLLEAVRRADEMSVFRERIPSTAARLRRTGSEASGDLVDDSDYELARRALAVLNTEASVADVARALHVAEFDATRACYHLLKFGVAELVKAAANAPAHRLSREDALKVDVFNVAFREIHDEIVRAGKLERFVVGVRKYLADPAHAAHAFFAGVLPDASGALPVDVLARNLGALTAEGHDASTVIVEALNELTFFMLFQCGELLDPAADDNLGRRVRLIHASLR